MRAATRITQTPQAAAGSLTILSESDAGQTSQRVICASHVAPLTRAKSDITTRVHRFAAALQIFVEEESGVRRADAVYTVSPAQLQDMRKRHQRRCLLACREKNSDGVRTNG